MAKTIITVFMVMNALGCLFADDAIEKCKFFICLEMSMLFMAIYITMI